MSLASGARFGPYEVLSPLGEGGMGEVYRARDTKLNRDVALKVLPAAFAHDRERVARFTREAQTLAVLNHHNIAAIYGIEGDALIMELVEGDDLSVRMARGPMRAPEALAIVRQIASALDAAHDRGIVHRDLKPHNVKVREDGTVKLLDFGLAKAIDRASSEQDPSADIENSPTLTAQATRLGTILGTAAYMAPEQARGRSVDWRADVWAFGVVLYEMLTGQRAFAGDTVSEILASVIKTEPDWTALPPDVPVALQRFLRRCLEKDPQKRLRDLTEGLWHFDETMSGAGAAVSATSDTGARPADVPAAGRWRRLATIAAAGLAASAITAAVLWTVRPAPAASPRVARFAITLGSFQVTARVARNSVAVSPDGRRIVYVADRQLCVKELDENDARPVSGSFEDLGVLGPVFSPDGQSIAYYSATDHALKRIPVGGGSPSTICPSQASFGLTWTGDYLFFGQTTGLLRVSASGGTPEMLVPIDPAQKETLFGPQLLPGGQTLLYTVASPAQWNTTGKIVVQKLGSRDRVTVVEGGAGDARYLPSGHIIYAKAGVVYAVAFDVATLRTRGAPVRVIEGVRRSEDSTGGMDLSVGDDGTLAYVPGAVAADQWSVAFFDPKGAMDVLKNPPGDFAIARLSPDGTRIALGSGDSAAAAIWIADVSGVTSARRLTFDAPSRLPVWSADGARVAFQAEHGGDRSVFWQRADGAGTADRLTPAERGVVQIPEAFSPDGQYLLIDHVENGAVTLWKYSLADQKTGRVDIDASSAPTGVVFSPDGHWIAYAVQAGTDTNAQVYVQPFPPTGARVLVSPVGEDAHHPVWSRDGHALFYTPGPGNRLQRIGVTLAPSFQFTAPSTIPRSFTNGPPWSPRPYDIARDGRILGLIETSATLRSDPLSRIDVVLNWFEELKTKVR